MGRCHALALILTGLVPWACAAPVKTYVPPRIAIEAEPASVLAAIKANAIAQGWTISQVDEKAGVIEARSPTTSANGFLEREVWLFTVSGRELTVRLIWQVQFDPSRDTTWVSTREVCRSYLYARERHQLVNVLAFIPGVKTARRHI